ncbi:MAG: pyridoxamine 5'-phosphate oxidase [Steroidobacteraceae bacterium]
MLARFQTLPDPLPADPMPLASTWFRQAWDEQVERNPNSMSLATTAADGKPSVRVVLCKEIVADPGYLVFYTNYDSRKGRELTIHPWAAVVFQWDALGRQLCVEGPVVHALASESDDYFASRPWRSRLAAITSAQSAPIATRQSLLDRLRETAERYGTPDPFVAAEDDQEPGLRLPRPANWGGYRLWAAAVELWVEGEHRLHDRARWTRGIATAGDGRFQAEPWQHQRLQP